MVGRQPISRTSPLGDDQLCAHDPRWHWFEKEAKEGSDPNVKSFASRTSEVVRKHLEMAKKIDSKLK